jgi:hypothetical protein
MLAPILNTKDSRAQLAPETVAAAIQAAAENTAQVMPPQAAKFMRERLLKVAESFTAHRAWFTVSLWADVIDEINAYAASAHRHTEHEVFLAGSSPEDAAFTRPAETLGDALAADQWLVGAGAAHRLVIQLHGPWVIDRPATAKESAA